MDFFIFFSLWMGLRILFTRVVPRPWRGAAPQFCTSSNGAFLETFR
jgi:hypothetical protein